MDVMLMGAREIECELVHRWKLSRSQGASGMPTETRYCLHPRDRFRHLECLAH